MALTKINKPLYRPKTKCAKCRQKIKAIFGLIFRTMKEFVQVVFVMWFVCRFKIFALKTFKISDRRYVTVY